MKWVGITGTWKTTSQNIENDVRKEVAAILNRGDGIITGGALGVDYYAMDEVIKHSKQKSRIKVYLPVSLPLYKAHYLRRADEGVITRRQAELLISVLEEIYFANPTSVIWNDNYISCDKESYFSRNGMIVENSDELYAFQESNSAGTQDTIEKAKIKGIKIKHFVYEP